MFRDFSAAIRDFRHGKIDATRVVAELAINHVGRTPNPQRVCMAIEIYDIMAPIIGGMMQPPVVLPLIPLPAYCTSPPAAGAVVTSEVKAVTEAVIAGLFD